MPSTHHSKSRSAGDYVLGTDDQEIARLRLQHTVWRPRAMSAWHRAGFTLGQHLLDVGCGPGFAAEDLATIVGDEGQVTAIDRSERFLEAMQERLARSRQVNIVPLRADLNEAKLPTLIADGAWCRWVFAFVTRPRELLANIRETLKPGAPLVIHEYFDYGTWRLAPRAPRFEEFVAVVMKSWRDAGGEPDIALDLTQWLAADGFRITSLRPIVDIVSPTDFVWQWPHAFAIASLRRLVQLGQLTEAAASEMGDAYAKAIVEPAVRMITPGVLEIIATRR
ncbi:MAG TPA: methyltransferase domain-containing protein [Gemmatimonadaceae bacterium]